MEYQLPLIFKVLLLWVGLAAFMLVIILVVGYFTPRRRKDSTAACAVTIWVKSDGFHVELFLPIQSAIYNWWEDLPLEKWVSYRSPQRYEYLSFGWGDRIFFQENPSWNQINFLSALRALFWTGNASAIRIYSVEHPLQLSGKTRAVRLSWDGYLHLVTFIKTSFQRDTQGKILPILPLTCFDDSRYFEAQGTYSVLRTCNTWIADALDTAGVTTPRWSALASAVMLHLGDACH